MASIRARHTRTGQTRYRAEVRLAGFDHCSKTFTTQREAKTWALHTESSLLATRDSNSGRPVRTVNDVIDRYLIEVLPLKPKARNQAQQLKWFKPEIGSLHLHSLSVADLKHCQTQLLNEPTDHHSAPPLPLIGIWPRSPMR